MGKGTKLIVIREFSNDIEAHIAKGVLESNGIACILNNEIMSSVYPLTLSSIGYIKLLVRQEDVAQANMVLDNSEKINQDSE